MTWAATCEDLATALGVTSEQARRIVEAQPALTAAAERTGVPLELLNGVAWVESRFSPAATSSAGARGLMQLMPATELELSKRSGIRGSWSDLNYNAMLGAHYLAALLARYQGREEWAVAAYNAGAGNVGKRGPSPWMAYVRAVQYARDRFVAAGIRCTGASLALPPWSPTDAQQYYTQQQTPAPPVKAPQAGGGAGVAVLLALVAWGLR